MAKASRIVISLLLIVYALLTITVVSLSETYVKELPDSVRTSRAYLVGQGQRTIERAESLWYGSQSTSSEL